MQARIVVPGFSEWVDVEKSICDLLSHLANTLRNTPVKRMEVSVKDQKDRHAWVHITGTQEDGTLCQLAFKDAVIPDGMSSNDFCHLVANKLGQVLYKDWHKEDFFCFVPQK